MGSEVYYPSVFIIFAYSKLIVCCGRGKPYKQTRTFVYRYVCSCSYIYISKITILMGRQRKVRWYKEGVYTPPLGYIAEFVMCDLWNAHTFINLMKNTKNYSWKEMNKARIPNALLYISYTIVQEKFWKFLALNIKIQHIRKFLKDKIFDDYLFPACQIQIFKVQAPSTNNNICTLQNIGGVKYWQIWRFVVVSPNFNLPKFWNSSFALRLGVSSSLLYISANLFQHCRHLMGWTASSHHCLVQYT